MSKTSSSVLTPSRKKRPRRLNAAKHVRCVDGLADCHIRLAALAGLMDACGEAMEAYQVRGLGLLVSEEVYRLGELRDTLKQEARR